MSLLRPALRIMRCGLHYALGFLFAHIRRLRALRQATKKSSEFFDKFKEEVRADLVTESTWETGLLLLFLRFTQTPDAEVAFAIGHKLLDCGWRESRGWQWIRKASSAGHPLALASELLRSSQPNHHTRALALIRLVENHPIGMRSCASSYKQRTTSQAYATCVVMALMRRKAKLKSICAFPQQRTTRHR
jgi:hypothetical protein